MVFNYSYQVQFSDTDGAGVVYFAQFLTICHGAYEASLQASGIELQHFFSGQWRPTVVAEEGNSKPTTIALPALAIPIVETHSKFYQPCRCGDRLKIRLRARELKDSEFEVNYEWLIGDGGDRPSRPAGTAKTRHVCLQIGDNQSRQRHPLPKALHHWLEFVASDDSAASPSNASS